MKQKKGFAGVFAYKWELYVLKDQRRKSIGKKLLEEIIQHSKSIGKARCHLLVNRWNEEGEEFFEKKGFTLRGYPARSANDKT